MPAFSSPGDGGDVIDPRPALHLLDADDLRRSVQDPALAALVRDGWRPGAHQLVEEAGRRYVALVLFPPTSPPASALTLGRLAAVVWSGAAVAALLSWGLVRWA